MQERLQKIIAAEGIASRRKAEELIRAGQVSVNGRIVTELGSKADPEHDQIVVQGKLLHHHRRVTYLLYKPRGAVSSRVKQGEQRERLVTQYVPAHPPVYPVGRLDRESEGLLLLSNDGELTAYLTHPKHGVEKEYHVTLLPHAAKDTVPSDELASKLLKGVWLSDGKIVAKHARIKQMSEEGIRLVITLTEGRHHAVRRLCATLGYKVKRLKRVRQGKLSLGKLKPGEFRELTISDLDLLRA